MAFYLKKSYSSNPQRFHGDLQLPDPMLSTNHIKSVVGYTGAKYMCASNTPVC